MFFDRSDKLFVTATADDAQFDELLTRFKRIRVGMTVAFISGLLILIILAAWLAIELLHVLRSPTFEMPPYLDRLSTLGTPTIIFATIVGYSCFTGLLDAAIAADGRVKLLLLFRVFRDSNAAKPK